jgi:hypothetical protein
VTVVKLKHIPSRKPIWDADIDRQPNITWTMGRSDIIDRLKACECLWCGATDVPLEVHHVRKLADVKNSPLWKRIKAARTQSAFRYAAPVVVDYYLSAPAAPYFHAVHSIVPLGSRT